MAILHGGVCEQWCEQLDADRDPGCLGREGSACCSNQMESQMARISPRPSASRVSHTGHVQVTLPHVRETRKHPDQVL